jgi:ketosteroid isomerase-like protein
MSNHLGIIGGELARGDNVEAVGRWFSSLQHGDPAPEMCDPEIEIRNWAESPIPGPYHGHDGLRRWWEELGEAFAELHWEPQRIEAIDERRCLTVQRLVGRFRHTGIETDAAWGAIVTVRDGKILSAVGYATPRQARRAAGLA